MHLSKSQEHPEAGRKDQEAHPQSIRIIMVAAAASFLEPQRRLPKGGRARVPKNSEQKTPHFIQSGFPVPKHRCPDLKNIPFDTLSEAINIEIIVDILQAPAIKQTGESCTRICIQNEHMF